MLREIVLSAAIFTAFGCTQSGETRVSNGDQRVNVDQPPAAVGSAETNVEKTAVQTAPPKPSETDKVTHFYVYPIEGFSEQKNADDVSQPPFTKATLYNLYPDKATRIDEKATIIPLKSAVAPFTLKIVKSTRIEQGCDGSIVWETELEPITDQAIIGLKPLNADENPRDLTLLEAAVIYPAVANSILMSEKQITAAMLPKAVKPSELRAAVDTDRDGKPDLILTQDKSFKKAGGKWQMMQEYLNEDC